MVGCVFNIRWKEKWINKHFLEMTSFPLEHTHINNDTIYHAHISLSLLDRDLSTTFSFMYDLYLTGLYRILWKSII